MARRLLTGLALALVLAGSATAADAPVRLKADPGGLLDLQSRQEKVGDHWRFVSTTDDRITGSRPRHQTNRLVFDVEVIALSSQAITLRYTLREVQIEDDSQPGILAAEQAFIGIPIEFEARQGYEPYQLTNWPAAKAAYMAALDRLAPGNKTLRQQVEAGFTRLEAGDPEALADAMVGDMTVLAGMQQIAAPRQRMEIPTQTTDLGEGRTMTVTGWVGLDSENAARCEATWSRETHRVGTGGEAPLDYDLNSTATLSTLDGWVLSLTETTKLSYGGDAEQKVVTITRQGAAPGCA